MNTFPFALPLDVQTIQTKRDAILAEVLEHFPILQCVPPPRIPEQALPFMLAAYDQTFLDGYLSRYAKQLTISASTRMTRAAGICRVTKSPLRPVKIEIRMGVDFLLRLGQGPFEANGLQFDTALEAFLSILEHELCHALDFLLFKKMDSHGPHYLALSQGLFGHKRCTHRLPTRAEEAASHGCGVGQWVTFPYQGQTLRGRITRVGKTATVMVPAADGAWRDAHGKRYAKYLVPPQQLRATSTE